VSRSRTRLFATLLFVLLGATLLGEAQALACAPACCCPAAQHAGGGCEALATSCCHAGEAPLAPGAPAPVQSPAPALALEAGAFPAAALRAASPLLRERPDSLLSPLRFSVVLRI
jgi:hypothetical protein